MNKFCGIDQGGVLTAEQQIIRFIPVTQVGMGIAGCHLAVLQSLPHRLPYIHKEYCSTDVRIGGVKKFSHPEMESKLYIQYNMQYTPYVKLTFHEESDSMNNRLEELRKQRGIRQEELAAALEVSRQTIGSLENGRYNPSILLAFKIARYFGLSIEEIFIYEEEEKK